MDLLSATESYSSLLFLLPNWQPMTVLSVFFLTIARLLPIFALAPFLGSKNLPTPIRMLFSIALVAIFLPQNLLTIHQEIPFGALFIFLAIKELLIGFFLGFLASVPFYIAQMAGTLIDHQRGASSMAMSDATTQSQTSPIGSLNNYVLIVIFFSLNGPFLFFDGIASSYQLIPMDQMIHREFFSPNPFWKQILALLQITMNLALQLSAPALIGVLLTDLFLGIANRLAPQVQIVFLGMSLKSWVAIAMLTASWAIVLQVMGKESISWINQIQQFIQQVITK